jgi:hypothetical protein
MCKIFICLFNNTEGEKVNGLFVLLKNIFPEPIAANGQISFFHEIFRVLKPPETIFPWKNQFFWAEVHDSMCGTHCKIPKPVLTIFRLFGAIEVCSNNVCSNTV